MTNQEFLRFQQGDEFAFEILYKEHFRRLCGIIRLYVGQREAMEDIVANAFIKLYNRRMQIREPDHVYGFLFVCARNEAADYYRDLKRQRRMLVAHERLADREYHNPREAELQWIESVKKIQQLTELLPPAQKKIFRLHFIEGLCDREIANQLNLAESTVRNQRNRALIFLRQAFLL